MSAGERLPARSLIFANTLEPRLEVRIGINAGEPVEEGNDLFGSAVNLAKRLCDAARGGELLETVAG